MNTNNPIPMRIVAIFTLFAFVLTQAVPSYALRAVNANESPEITNALVSGMGHAITARADGVTRAQRPIIDASPDRPTLEKWLRVLPKRLKPLGKFIVDDITYIDQKKFEEKLHNTVSDFNNKNPRPFPYVVVSPDIKPRSNTWVHNIALEMGLPPTEYFQPRDSFVLSFWLKENPNIKDIMIIDDAAYSGAQMYRNIEQLAKLQRKLHVHILVPFMTRYAHEAITSFIASNLTIEIYKHENMPTIGELIKKSTDRKLIEEILSREIIVSFSRDQTLTYFQHTMSDNRSFVPFGWDFEGKASIGDPLGRYALPRVWAPYREGYQDWIKAIPRDNPELVSRIISPSPAPRAAPAAGLCVTGDTMLPIVYDTMDEGRGTREEKRYALKPIIAVKPGEYVLSLNEETQEIEPHRINALLDMGVKPVYKLITASGRSVKTTANHPYLVKIRNPKSEIRNKSQIPNPKIQNSTNSRWTKVSELKAGDEIACTVMPQAFYGAVPNLIGLCSDRDFGNQNIIAFPVKNNSVVAGSKTISFASLAFNGVSIMKGVAGGNIVLYLFNDKLLDMIWEFLQLAVGVLGKTIGYHFKPNRCFTSLEETRPDLRDSSISSQNSEPEHSIDSNKSINASLSKKNPLVINPPLCLEIRRTKPFSVFPGSLRNWERLTTFSFNNKDGNTIFSPPKQNKYSTSMLRLSRLFSAQEAEAAQVTSAILWDRIASIQYLGYEHVWDIEVDGTHNFIAGNAVPREDGTSFYGGIFAHNTYTGAAAPAAGETPARTGGMKGSMQAEAEVKPELLSRRKLLTSLIGAGLWMLWGRHIAQADDDDDWGRFNNAVVQYALPLEASNREIHKFIEREKGHHRQLLSGVRKTLHKCKVPIYIVPTLNKWRRFLNAVKEPPGTIGMAFMSPKGEKAVIVLYGGQLCGELLVHEATHAVMAVKVRRPLLAKTAEGMLWTSNKARQEWMNQLSMPQFAVRDSKGRMRPATENEKDRLLKEYMFRHIMQQLKRVSQTSAKKLAAIASDPMLELDEPLAWIYALAAYPDKKYKLTEEEKAFVKEGSRHPFSDPMYPGPVMKRVISELNKEENASLKRWVRHKFNDLGLSDPWRVSLNRKTTALSSVGISLASQAAPAASDMKGGEAAALGQCVAGDTMLPIVEELRDDGRWTKDDGRRRLKPIVKVKPGEYVLSLNEATQDVEPHRINALLDMGVKPVYKLTTASGRSVKTTANHPYLVRRGTMDEGRWTRVSELEAGDEIACPVMPQAFYGAVPLSQKGIDSARHGSSSWRSGKTTNSLLVKNSGDGLSTRSFLRAIFNWLISFGSILKRIIPAWSISGRCTPKSLSWVMSVRFFETAKLKTSPLAKPLVEMAASCPRPSRNGSSWWWTFSSNKKSILYLQESWVKLAAFQNTSSIMQSLLYMLSRQFWVGISDFFYCSFGLKHLKDQIYHYPSSFKTGLSMAYIRIYSDIIFNLHSNFPLQKSVYHMLVGLSSAFTCTAYAQPPTQGHVLWDKIASIEYIGYEHVWDIEVGGTHNFIANGIFAHNTYATVAAAPAAGETGRASHMKGSIGERIIANVNTAGQPEGDEIAPSNIARLTDSCIHYLEGQKAFLEAELSTLAQEDEISIRVTEQVLSSVKDRLRQAMDARERWKGIGIRDFPAAVKAELADTGAGELSASQKKALYIVERGCSRHPDIAFNTDRIFFVPRSSWLYDFFGLTDVGASNQIIHDGDETIALIVIKDREDGSEDPLYTAGYIVHELMHDRFNKTKLYMLKNRKREFYLFDVLDEAMTEELTIRMMTDIFYNIKGLRKYIERKKFTFMQRLLHRAFGKTYHKELVVGGVPVRRMPACRFLNSIVDNMGPQAREAVMVFLTEGDFTQLQRLFGPAWDTVLDITNRRGFQNQYQGDLEYRLGMYLIGQALKYPSLLEKKMAMAAELLDSVLKLTEAGPFREIFNPVLADNSIEPDQSVTAFELKVIACEKALAQALKNEQTNEDDFKQNLYVFAQEEAQEWLSDKKSPWKMMQFGSANYEERMAELMRYFEGPAAPPAAPAGSASAKMAGEAVLVITNDLQQAQQTMQEALGTGRAEDIKYHLIAENSLSQIKEAKAAASGFGGRVCIFITNPDIKSLVVANLGGMDIIDISDEIQMGAFAKALGESS